ncbi:uncharacterized protein [Engystomops pustulosus]|uniref:uncharacterized protein n=1 Tax=Engystomops pustulosus TaxID=76066 RepID=UPI003AFB6182
MRTLPALVCLLVLIHRGHCLNCIKCMNQHGLSCPQPQVTCDTDQDVCQSTVFITSDFLGRNTTSIYRGCGKSQFCDFFFSYINGLDTIDVSVSCCAEDDCRSPPPDERSNGLECPSLHSRTKTSPQVLQCKGNQRKCFYTTETVGSGDIISTLGCANHNYCSGFITNMTEIRCQDATPSATTTTAMAPDGHYRLLPPSSRAGATAYSQLLCLLGLILLYVSQKS